MTRLAALVPLLAVFVLALLMGFVGRVMLAPDATAAALLSPGAARAAFAGADLGGSGPRRRRLAQGAAAGMLPFRLNPLAGQLPRGLSADDNGAIDPALLAPRGIGAPAARGTDLPAAADRRASGAVDAAASGPVAGESAPDPHAAGGAQLEGPAAAPAGSAAAAAGAAAPVLAPEVQQRPMHDGEGHLLPLETPLRVCLMSADFYGLPNPGPIAIHFHLLAEALAQDPSLQARI
jgi:hypothetical protein